MSGLLIAASLIASHVPGTGASGDALMVAAARRRRADPMAVSVDGRLAGVVAVADRVRSGAAQMVAELHAAEVKKVVMLTGDVRRAAEAVAVMRQNS